MSIKTCVDCGHEGKNIDPGAVGKNGTYESDVVYKIGQKLKEKLLFNGVGVVLTRKDQIQKISLAERCKISNDNNCDYFISLHFNGSKDPKVTGTETIIYRHANTRAQNLATKINWDLSKALGTKNRGVIDCVDLDKNLAVLRGTKANAILIEVDFITNEDVEKKTHDENYIELVANTIAKSFVGYIGQMYKNPHTPKPDPKPIIKPDPKEIFIVCCGAFSVKENADKLVQELKQKGYKDAYIKKG